MKWVKILKLVELIKRDSCALGNDWKFFQLSPFFFMDVQQTQEEDFLLIWMGDWEGSGMIQCLVLFRKTLYEETHGAGEVGKTWPTIILPYQNLLKKCHLIKYSKLRWHGR